MHGSPTVTTRRIFDTFVSTKRATGKGLGLGLAITCQLIRRNGGTIDVTSGPDIGTTFTIRFPTGKPSPTPESPPATPVDNGRTSGRSPGETAQQVAQDTTP